MQEYPQKTVSLTSEQQTVQEDNLQKTLLDNSWLAGIWDGEGSIGFTHVRRKRGKDYFCPLVSIGNTSREMMEEILRIMGKIGINPHITFQERKSKKHSPCWKFMIRRHEQIRNFLPTIIPFLITKKELAELLVEYTTIRKNTLESGRKIQERDSKGRIVSGYAKQDYSKREREIIDRVYYLNAPYHEKKAKYKSIGTSQRLYVKGH